MNLHIKEKKLLTRMKNAQYRLVFFMFGSAILSSSCAFNFELTSQRTALENQILGTYKELNDDLIVTNYDKNSNRKDKNPNSVTTSTNETEWSIKNRTFNADDINELKDDAILGEGADGLLALLPKGTGDSANATSGQIKLAEALIDEENLDRSRIWNSTVLPEDGNASSSAEAKKGLPAIQEAFAREMYTSSPNGRWFYVGKKWTPKQ
jgi:hypothetical protein